jgi:uncharacterized protein (UPF0332 family)
MFDWHEYYRLARNLLSLAESISKENMPRKEAILRSAISRAYYAAFHAACDYLKQVREYPTEQEIKTSRKGTHQVIIDRFIANPTNPERDEIGQRLNLLKSDRHRADYINFSKKHAFRKVESVRVIIDEAEEIIKLIDSLRA